MMLAALLGIGSLTAPMPAQADGFVVKDLRDIEPDSVRFAAGVGTKDSQAIVLLGGNKEVWPKIRDAVQQAESQGCPVRAIVVGPADAPPSLEIYALGLLATNPINPYDLKQSTLEKLICGIHKEFFIVNREYYTNLAKGDPPQP